MRFRIPIFLLLFIQAFPALADNQSYNHVDFSSKVERSVANDLMIATLGIDVSEPRPDVVAQKMAVILNAELKRAAAFGMIKVSSGNQSTYPVYGKSGKAIQTWRGHAGIRLESTDFSAMGKLIAQLQGRMQLNGIRFVLSGQSRRNIENSLIANAIEEFRKRAKVVSTAMGGRRYRIIHITISNGGAFPAPRLMAASRVMPGSAVPQQQFAGDESTISVQVSGTIEVTH